MKRRLFFLMLCALVLTLSLSVGAAGGSKDCYAKYLSAADVTKITGIQGIKAQPDYTLYFFDGTGKKILQVRIDDKTTFATDTKIPNSFTPLNGIGEKAVILLPTMPYQIDFIKGKQTIVVTTFPKEGLKCYLTADQLKAVSKLLDSRLKEPF